MWPTNSTFTRLSRGVAFFPQPIPNIWSSSARRLRRRTRRLWTSRWTANTASIHLMRQSATGRWLRALPDFGNSLNTHDDDFNYRAMDAMFAHAYGICHVKDGEVDDNGKPTHVDLARTFAIMKKHGYKGYCSIEYDAPGDPYKPTAELVEKTVKFLA